MQTVRTFQEAQADFDRAHQGAVPFFEPISDKNIEALEHLIVCLTGEVGELANIVKKIRRGDFMLAEAKAGLVEETADIFIYILKLANQIDFDLTDAYLRKMKVNEERFKRYEK